MFHLHCYCSSELGTALFSSSPKKNKSWQKQQIATIAFKRTLASIDEIEWFF